VAATSLLPCRPFSCRFPSLRSLVISIAVSLTCHRSVSPAVAPEKSKRQAEFSASIESKISVMRDPMREGRTGSRRSMKKKEGEREREREGRKEGGRSSRARFFSPRESAKWSALPIITFSFHANNANVTRRSPKDIEREKITRADDSRRNAGEREKQPHNSASCTRAATWPAE